MLGPRGFQTDDVCSQSARVVLCVQDTPYLLTMTNASAAITVHFRGSVYSVPFDPGSTTCSSFIQALQQAVPGLAAETLKVLVPKPKARNLQLAQDPELLLSQSGISPGMKLMLLGSFTSELQALQASKKAELSLRLPDFEHEAQRVAQRRSLRGSRAGNGPTGHHCFGSFDVLPLPRGAPPQAPPPSAALSLLHRIATDPAIAHVMTTHGWQVGLLSELAPEGKVGVSAMCVLGYNVNKGQEISLRLRTDDYRGFRKYLRIRETLVHELAHMVHSEHDNNFKALNSQLLREVTAHEAAASSGGRTLAGSGVFEGDWLGQQQQDIPAAARGNTLGGGQSTAAADTSSAQQAAAAAALARWQQQQAQQQQLMEAQQEGCSAAVAAEGGSEVTTAGSGPIPAEVVDQAMADADQTSTAAAAVEAREVTVDSGTADALEAAVAGVGLVDDGSLTDDPATAAAEVAMRRLGSMDYPEDGRLLETPVQPPQQQLQQQQQQGLLGSGTAAAYVPMRSDTDVQQAQGDSSVPMDTSLATDIEAEGWQQEQRMAQVPPLGPSASLQEIGSEVHDLPEHAFLQINALPAAAIVATSAHHDDSVSVDDVVTQKLQQAQVLLQDLQQQASSSSQEALKALDDVLTSIAQHPNEQRYRRLRCGNAAFQRRLGQYPAAVQLLLLAGFAEQQLQWQEGGKPETVLVYVRNDPGLLWLVVSAVKSCGQF